MDVLIVVGALFAGVGALLFAVGAALRALEPALRPRRRARAGPGRRRPLADARDRGLVAASTTSATPVLRFTLPDGRTVETGRAHDDERRRRCSEGRAVTVLYDPADPQPGPDREQRRAGPAHRRLMVIGGLFFLLGLALVAGGIALRDALPEQ